MILEDEQDVFSKGTRVRFKRDIHVSSSGSVISYEQIPAGTEGVVHAVVPFVIRILPESSVIKEVLWEPLDGLDESIEIIRDYPGLRIVK